MLIPLYFAMYDTVFNNQLYVWQNWEIFTRMPPLIWYIVFSILLKMKHLLNIIVLHNISVLLLKKFSLNPDKFCDVGVKNK